MDQYSNYTGSVSMVKIFDITFKNRVFSASGVFGFGLKYPHVANAVGAVITKGITLKPRQGNPPPRIFETPAGLINWVGLENPGVEVFCERIIPEFKKLKTRVIANVAGFSIDEYVRIVQRIKDRVDAFEINVSCPNVKQGGAAFGQDPDIVGKIIGRVRKQTKRPIIVKLTPNFCDPLRIAKVCVDMGADGVSLINTLYGMAYDVRTRKPLIIGGLSGPAIRPFALYCVNRIRDIGVPIIGMGGIMTGRDAYEFLLAGASAVAVGSAMLRDPEAPIAIIRELDAFLKKGYNGKF
jgi:dihydroorotate dehydrogenase (NAD+) catalytic subunit